MYENAADEVPQGAAASPWQGVSVDTLHYAGVDLKRRVSLEGRVARHELEHEDAQGPPVHSRVVPRAGNKLWGEVVRGAAGGKSFAEDELREAHVRQFNLTLVAHQDVLGLQISVD